MMNGGLKVKKKLSNVFEESNIFGGNQFSNIREDWRLESIGDK